MPAIWRTPDKIERKGKTRFMFYLNSLDGEQCNILLDINGPSVRGDIYCKEKAPGMVTAPQAR